MIEFSALNYLPLNNLPNIISICLENYHPTWPSLESLYVGGCSQLDLRSINYWIARSGLGQKDYETSEEINKGIVTPLETLQSVVVQNTKIEVIFNGEGISDTEQQVNSSLQHLRLYELPELRHIWRVPKNFLLLQNLRKLIIHECRNLKVIFPAFVLRNMQQLRELDIKKCKELEEIIEEESPSLSNPHQLALPNLIAIFIRHCHKLKHVFPISKCHTLPKLRILFIHEASEVEKVFGDDQGETGEIRKENLIPNLEYVILWQLTKLTTGGQRIDLQAVRYLLVQHCPILNITSTIDPQRLLQILDNEKAAYWDDCWELQFALEDIIESNEDCGTQVESLSHSQNNEQKLTPITSPTSTEEVEGSFECSPSSDSGKKITSSTHSNLASSKHGIICTSSTNTLPHIQSQIKFNQRKPDAEKDGQVIPVVNLPDLKDDDLISVLESVEDYYAVATSKDELVANALDHLEGTLKMPLKDIATSEANSLRLQTALNFLSRLSLEDGALSHGVMVIIKSMHKNLPDILSSFKQAFATINKFTVLEGRDKSMTDELTQRKEVAVALVSKTSETQKFMDEAQQKEARLPEHISRWEKERTDCEAELLSLQEQKRKYTVEAIEFKKQIEAVRKDKSEMVEDQRNARQQVFQIDHKWSVLCSQFELAIVGKTNLS